MIRHFTYSVFVFLLLQTAVAKAFETPDTLYKNNPKPKGENKTREQIFVPPLIIKTSPTAFLFGGVFPYTAEYRFMIEKTCGKKQSQQLAVSYLGKSLILTMLEDSLGFTNNEKYKVSGWRVQYAHKFFWIGRRKYAPYGFYFGPLISYANARVSIGLRQKYAHAYYDFRHFSINGIIGVQVGKIDRLTLDVYAGLGYKNNKIFYHSPRNNSYYPYDSKDFGNLYNSHLNGVFGVNIGYSL